MHEPASVKAVILVAGIGSRLRPHTDARPKCLLDVTGEPLLTRMLRQIAAAGMEEAVLVTGHMDTVITEYLGERTPPVTVATVFNPEYDSLGNAHSLLVARDAVGKAPFIKLDGDLILDDGLLPQLLETPHDSALLLDSGATLAEEEMRVKADEDGRVTALGKWLDPASSTGESIGVELIGARHSAALFRALRRVVHEEGQGGAYYEDVYHRLLADGWDLYAVDTEGAPWTEIDTSDDLMRARRMFGDGGIRGGGSW